MDCPRSPNPTMAKSMTQKCRKWGPWRVGLCNFIVQHSRGGTPVVALPWRHSRGARGRCLNRCAIEPVERLYAWYDAAHQPLGRADRPRLPDWPARDALLRLGRRHFDQSPITITAGTSRRNELSVTACCLYDPPQLSSHDLNISRPEPCPNDAISDNWPCSFSTRWTCATRMIWQT